MAAGNSIAFSHIFFEWKDRLYSFATRFTDCPEEAEDIVQDVFTKLWTNREKLTAVREVGSYLFKMIQNKAISGLHRKALENQFQTQVRKEWQEAGMQPDETIIYKEVRERIQEIVRNLPDQQRKVYRLSREEGLRQEEIACRLNIAISTVDNHMRLALSNIRKRLILYYPAGSPLILIALAGLTVR